MRSRNSMDHTTMREMNVTLILDTLRRQAPISRAALAASTGLNKTSVSSMVKDLISSAYIHEIGVSDSLSDIGRPAINLQLNPDAGYMIGAEIGVGFISVIAADFGFQVVTRRYERIAPDAPHAEVLAYFVELLQEVHHQVARRGRPLFGVAVGVPGLVEMPTGRLLFAPNLDWRDVPIRDMLRKHFDLPIVVANEANMAALGESYFGIGQDSHLLLYVSSGVGLGGGIVIGGQLLTGFNGLSGEFGHMTVRPDGAACRCGSQGCWETEATQTALIRRARAAFAVSSGSNLARYGDQLTLPLLIEAARGGDRAAMSAFEETARWLGVGVANLVNVLNPEHVIFGGPLSAAYDLMAPFMRAEIERRALRWVWEKAQFAAATYTTDAVAMGGMAMIHRHVINHPMTWQSRLEFMASS